MISRVELAEIATDAELIELLNCHADDDATIDTILAEIERREDADDEVDEQSRLVAMVNQERRPGETLEQTVDRMYGDHTYTRYLQAEDYARGHLLNKKGLDAKVHPYSLFHGPAVRAAIYASQELRDWWDANGRITWIEYKATMLGRPSDIQRARQVRRRASDFGL